MPFSFNRIRYLLFDKSLYGDYSGYPQVSQAVRAQFSETTEIVLQRPAHRIRQKLLSVFSPRRFAISKFWWSEQVFTQNGTLDGKTVYHSLNFNVTPTLWERLPAHRNLVATFHYSDPSNLPEETIELLQYVLSGITLAESHLGIYQELCPHGRIEFVHHGVDTRFFQPSNRRPEQQRLLFVGRVARNFDMLVEVLEKLSEKHPNLGYDLVLQERMLEYDFGQRLQRIRGVSFHHGIPDRQLLHLYQNAFLLLLPLEEASANNSIVEALATGLPVVTTDASGVRSYAGGTVYPVVDLGDVDGMVGLVEHYLADLAYRDHVATCSRKFAEEYLSWEKSARAHLQAYERLLH